MKRLLHLLPVILLMLMIVPSSGAQSGGYDLSWNVVAGGGTTFSTGEDYTLGATIGQAAANSLSGGGYTLNGGFWNGTMASYNIYLPIVLRG
ncbi:hypothetical protein TFLX_06513 [Thermoflexales bacterium]|nr:hypothetical protein TFLX_06513 [Thermoflexales bacterium]